MQERVKEPPSNLSLGWLGGLAEPLASALLFAAMFFVCLLRIYALPPWWDEGWTLSVARTWVEYGQYGRLLNGQVVGAGLSASFPTTALVALSFKLFGVGIWQGRLVSVLLTIGALGLLFMLAKRLYGRSVAWAALAVLLLTNFLPDFNPLAVAPQVVAEPLMLCSLLAGYACFLAALRRPIWLPAAALCWALTMLSKGQPTVFLVCSLLLMLGWALLRRRWRVVLLLAGALAGAWLLQLALAAAWALLVLREAPPPEPLDGLLNVMGFVLSPYARLDALAIVLGYGLPTLAGLCYAAWRLLRDWRDEADGERELLRVGLLGFAAAWFAWYALLSAGWLRYLYPALFVGSVFVAAALHDLTGGFRLRAIAGQFAELRATRAPRARLVLTVLSLALIVSSGFFTIRMLYSGVGERGDTALNDTLRFLNTRTPPGALIESYDAELYTQLERPYHRPPDQLHVLLTRQLLWRSPGPIPYDPLAADPDYLVVGAFVRNWHVYDAALASGAFRPVQRYGDYEIYQRAR